MPKQTKNFPNFKSPAELLAFYDEDILQGKIKQYPWQIEIPQLFSQFPPQGQMLEIDVVAANESGKSKMLVAPCALWSCCQYDKAETVVTSASGSQLDRQTGRYIKDYARRMNLLHGGDLWTIQHRLLKFGPTDGMMDLFATDEPGKAEGWHQRDFDSAFTIIVDEAKSVGDEIFQALDRCHDAQRTLRVSSPAIGTNGYFYKRVVSGKTRVFKITAFQCPHITKFQIDKIIQTYGLHSPLTKSIIFAEFSSTNETVVINYDVLYNLVNRQPLPLLNKEGQPIRVGGDLAAGGDENVLSIWQGNQQIGLECFLESDTTLTVKKIIFFLEKYAVPRNSEHIFMDDGGVGKAIIDSLREKGWNIKRILNQSTAINNRMFSNRGAELWFNFATFINHEELRFINDPTLISQLSNRYYKQSSQGKILLESKRDAKAHGHPSPDRADATVLAFTGMVAPFYTIIGNASSNISVAKSAAQMTNQELIEMMDNYTYAQLEGRSSRRGNPVNFSMNALLQDQQGGNGDFSSRMEELAEQLKYLPSTLIYENNQNSNN